LYQRADFEVINQRLDELLPEFQDDPAKSVDYMWQTFYSRFVSIIRAMVPTREVKADRMSSWLIASLKRVFERRYKAHRTAKKGNS